MGAADREAVAQGLMHEDGLDLVPVVVDDDTYRQAYDVVANTTLWYVHHHLFDLPHRPRFDRHWRAAWEGYRAYNRAVADVVVGAGRRGRRRLRAGLPLLARWAGCWPSAGPICAPCTSCTRPSPSRPCWPCCPTTSRPSCSTAWRATTPAGSTATSGRRGFLACYAAAGEPAPPTFVAPLGPDAGVLEEEAAAPAVAAAAEALRAEVGGRRIVARADRMEPSKNIVRGMLAFEELLHAHPEWRGEVVHVALAYPSRQGLAEYLAYAADVAHTAERINHAFVGSATAGPTDTLIVLSVEDDRPARWPRYAGRRALGQSRCATGSTWWPRRGR